MYKAFSLDKSPVHLEITNSCTCTEEDGSPAVFCDGRCWECECNYIESLGVVGKTWHVDASNIGWQNRSGEKEFYCDSGETFLCEIVGFDCRWTMQLMASRRKPATLTARIYHHDSPTGETREIRRIS